MKKVALFVGVDEYVDGTIANLQHAVDDSEELAAVFKRLLDFERVEKLRNPAGKKDILRKVRELTEGLKKGDLFFFYFAGHGFRVKDNHVLVCAEDEYRYLQDEDDGLRVGLLKEEARGPWDRMLVIDACQNDIRSTRGASGGMSARDLALILEDKAGRARQGGDGTQVVVTSCGEGQQALEVEELGHGLFTSALLEMVTEHARTRTRLDMEGFRREMAERMGILAQTYRLNGKQNPLFGMPGDCEIVLLDGGGTASVAPPVFHAPVAAPTFVTCPVCGKRNKPEDTFRCRECGREDLCLRHQGQTGYLCSDCAAAQQRQLAVALARHKQACREEERRAREAAEAESRRRELAEWEAKKWRLPVDRLVGMAAIMMPVLVCFFLCRGLSINFEETGHLWPWARLHLKFGVGVGTAVTLVAFILHCVIDKEAGSGDKKAEVVVPRRIYDEKVRPWADAAMPLAWGAGLVAWICSVVYTFHVLGFCLPAFGVSALCAAEDFLCCIAAPCTWAVVHCLLWQYGQVSR